VRYWQFLFGLHMKNWLTVAFVFCLLVSIVDTSWSQSLPVDVKEKIDKLALSAFQAAQSQFPCKKVKSEGSPKMFRWQDVERCLEAANGRVDWENISQQLRNLRQETRIPWMDIAAVMDSALASHTVRFDEVFKVRSKSTEVLLPLPNVVLKFLPAGSLQDVPIYTKKGYKIGAFAGVYIYERSGDLTVASNSKQAIFQYVDSRGDIHVPPTVSKLLLDKYGVYWKDAKSQPGFRLPSDKLIP
jgi:hypothetical protein